MHKDKKTIPNKMVVTVYPGNTTSYLDNSNPYIMNDDNHNQTYARYESPSSRNGSVDRGVILPEDLLVKASQLDAINCPVRTIVMLDIVMSCLYFLDGLIGGIVCLLASINGYIATIYYKQSLMICYLLYQYFQVFLQLTNIISLIAEPQQYGYNHTFSEFSVNNRDRYFLNIGVFFFLFFCQITVAVFITKYYQLLPDAQALQRIRLIQHAAI